LARAGRILAWVVGGLLLILGVSAAVLATFDWSRLKPTITERASAALGRTVAIDGPLEVDWRMPWEAGVEGVLPRPHITAHELSIGNPDWASTPHFATLERIAFTLRPWPLLGRRVVIPHIELGRPAVFLERQESGRNNWTFGKEDDAAKQDESGKGSGWQVDIGEIAFDRGHVRLDDARREAHLEATLEPLGEPIPFGKIARGEPAKREVAQDYAFAWTVEGTHRKEKVRGEGRTGGLLALNDRDRPFPIQADVSVGHTRIAAVGTLTDPRDLAALDLNLRLSGRSMSELYPIVRVTLPDTPPYSTDGHLTARLREPEGSIYRYEDFTGRVGESDLRGTLEYAAREPQPRLTGTLGSRQLRIQDLGPLVGAGAAEEGDEPEGGVLPEQEFRTQRWKAMDADVRFQGERIERGEGLPLTNVDVHLMLDNGLLRLAPLAFGMAGGRIEGEIRLDSRDEPLAGKLDLEARGFELVELFPDFEPIQAHLGEMNGGAELAGHGNSVGALLGSADGGAQLLVDGGAVSSALMELAGLNFGRYLVDQLFGDELVRINCLLADFMVDDGVMRPQVFVLDTENMVVRVNGTIRLGAEELDLTVHPRSKGMRILSLRSPLYVQGSFAEPDVGVKPGPLVARGAGAAALGAAIGPLAGLLALIAPGTSEGSRCTPVLERLRSEGEGQQQ